MKIFSRNISSYEYQSGWKCYPIYDIIDTECGLFIYFAGTNHY